MKKHIYFLPGMFASSTIFEHISLPEDQFESHYIEWIMPLHKRETLSSYINRLSKKIKHSNPIFIGVSFGGIIAQELSKKFENSKVIIISSIKHQKELKPSFKFYKYSKLYKLFPITGINNLEPILFRIGSKSLQKKISLYRKYTPIRNKLYTSWAIYTFLHWEQNKHIDLLHLHGDKDPILPIKQPSNIVEIKNGNHAMIIYKPSTIQKEIIKYLT